MTEYVTVRLTLGQARWLVERVPVLPAPRPNDQRAKAGVYAELAHALGERAERPTSEEVRRRERIDLSERLKRAKRAVSA